MLRVEDLIPQDEIPYYYCPKCMRHYKPKDINVLLHVATMPTALAGKHLNFTSRRSVKRI